jgi:hypothetical protein
MATNFISEFASGTEYSSPSGYFISYGLMILYFVFAVIGLVLFQKDDWPNQSPESAAVAAVMASHATSRRWLSFFR